MASSPASPSTPLAETPRRTVLNRSFTTPAKLPLGSLSNSLKGPEIGAPEGIETLYVHPNATIIKFTTSSSTSRPGSSGSPGRPQSSHGTEPWASPTERTLAVGQMEIYRVPGSVSFVRSGSLLQAILPRSQCWCVDGVSKFALRVPAPNTYYRIELPGATEEDLQEVERFKETLRKVLFFERTPCPFSRTFTVDLPEEPEVRKKRRESSGPAKRWRLESGNSWRPEGWVPPEEGGEDSSPYASSGASEEENDSDAERRDEVGEVADDVKELRLSTSARPKVTAGFRSVTTPTYSLPQASPLSKLRTAENVDGTVEASEEVEPASSKAETPRTRTLQAIPTSMPPSPPESSAGADYTDNQAQSVTEEINSSEHVTQPEESLPPAEPDRHSPAQTSQEHAVGDELRRKLAVEKPAILDAETSLSNSPEDGRWNTTVEAVSTHSPELPPPTTTRQSPAVETSTRPITPPNPRPPTTQEDPFAAIQARILARRSIGGTTTFHPGRKSSPTRSSISSTASSTTSNLSRTSTSAAQKQQQRDFASAMVQKACAAFLGPPAKLVAIMLRIAARYADAAFGANGVFYVESPVGQRGRVPGSFLLEEFEVEGGDWRDEMDKGDEDDRDEDEDDFGVPLRSPVRVLAGGGAAREGMRERGGRGWDVD